MIDITGLREDKRPQSSTIVHALLDRLEAVEKERDSYKFAFSEYSEKTEWVQQGINDGTVSAKYLCWHRADVMSDLLRAAEKERDAMRTELDALLAWKEEAERQEPVAEVVEQDTSTHGHARGIRHLQAELLPAKTRLYTRPIPAQSAQEGWQLMPKEVADLYGFMCSAFVPMTGQQEEIAKQLDLAKQAMKAAPKPEVK